MEPRKKMLLLAVLLQIASVIGLATYVSGVHKREDQWSELLGAGMFRVQTTAGVLFFLAHLSGTAALVWEAASGALMYSIALSLVGLFGLVPSLLGVRRELKLDLTHGAIRDGAHLMETGGTLLVIISFAHAVLAGRERRGEAGGERRAVALAVPLAVSAVLCFATYDSASYAEQATPPVFNVGVYGVAACLVTTWLLSAAAWRRSAEWRLGVAVFSANLGLLSLRSGLGASAPGTSDGTAAAWPASSIVFGVACLLVAYVLGFFAAADDDDTAPSRDKIRAVPGAGLTLIGAIVAFAAMRDVQSLLPVGGRPQYLCTCAFGMFIAVTWVLAGELRRPGLATIAFSMALDNSWHTAHFAGLMLNPGDVPGQPSASHRNAGAAGAILMLLGYGGCLWELRRHAAESASANDESTGKAVVRACWAGIGAFVLGALCMVGASHELPSPLAASQNAFLPMAAGWVTQGFMCSLLLRVVAQERGDEQRRWAACAAVLLALKVSGFLFTMVGSLSDDFGHDTKAPYRAGHALMLLPCLVLGPLLGITATRGDEVAAGANSYMQTFG